MAGDDKETPQGNKDTTGKVRMDLFPPKTFADVCAGFTYGAEKYSDWNWLKGVPISKYEAAAKRHMEADKAGEILDPETGVPNLALAICCLTIMNELRLRPDCDDRPKGLLPPTLRMPKEAITSE